MPILGPAYLGSDPLTAGYFGDELVFEDAPQTGGGFPLVMGAFTIHSVDSFTVGPFEAFRDVTLSRTVQAGEDMFVFAASDIHFSTSPEIPNSTAFNKYYETRAVGFDGGRNRGANLTIYALRADAAVSQLRLFNRRDSVSDNESVALCVVVLSSPRANLPNDTGYYGDGPEHVHLQGEASSTEFPPLNATAGQLAWAIGTFDDRMQNVATYPVGYTPLASVPGSGPEFKTSSLGVCCKLISTTGVEQPSTMTFEGPDEDRVCGISFTLATA